MTASLRVAVVGTGEISRQVASDLALTPGATLYAISAPTMEGAAAFAASVGGRTRTYNSYIACLADPDVDLVYLGTPHATHYHLALRAIHAGKHVLVEKPMTMDAAHARSLMNAARGAGVFLMEGMWMKFNAVIRSVVQLISEGAIGEVRSVQASFGLPFPKDAGSRWQPELGGSALLDQGIYPVTLARMMLGEATGIRAGGTVRTDGLDLTGHMTLLHSDDRFAQLAWSMVGYTDLTASVNGTGGWITIHPEFWSPERATLTSLTFGSTPETTEIHIPCEGFGFVPMLASVADAIAAGSLENPLHPMSDTIAVLTVLDEARAQLVA